MKITTTVFMISVCTQSKEDYHYSVYDFNVQTEPWGLPLHCLWFQCADRAMKTTTTMFMISVCRQSHEDCRQHRPCWLPALSVSPPEPWARFVEVLKYRLTAKLTATTTIAAATSFPKFPLFLQHGTAKRRWLPTVGTQFPEMIEPSSGEKAADPFVESLRACRVSHCLGAS